MTNFTANNTECVIEAGYDVAAVACIHCGSVEKVYKHGTKEQRLHDTPAHGKHSLIVVKRLRYMCRDCGKTFLQPLPDMAESGSMTKRLRAYIEKNSLKHTFAHVAGEVGLDEKTIRNIFNEYADWLDKNVTFETPEVLGLDETYLLGKPRLVAVNVEESTIIGVLEDRNKPTLHEWLMWGLKDKQNVRLVTMDMWKPYKDAANVILPHAQVVVDKFHIVRMATQALESVRRGLRDEMTTTKRREVMRSRFLALKRKRDLTDDQRAKLEEWTNTLPTLGKAYRLKESYYDIFDLTDRAEAAEAYRKWELEMPDDMRPAFKALTTAMRNWHKEVFAIIEFGVSNAVVETLNGITKIMNRNGRGYSFRAIRAKMLFNKHAQWTEERRVEWAAPDCADGDDGSRDVEDVDRTREQLDDLIEHGAKPPLPTYGTHLEHLKAMLEREDVGAASPPPTTPTPHRRRRSK